MQLVSRCCHLFLAFLGNCLGIGTWATTQYLGAVEDESREREDRAVTVVRLWEDL